MKKTKLTWTRPEIKKIKDKRDYDRAVHFYMLETGKFPPPFGGRAKRDLQEESTIRSANQTPDVSIDFTVVPVGYQMDLYLKGKLARIECRDFGGAPKPSKSVELLIQYLDKAVENWRSFL